MQGPEDVKGQTYGNVVFDSEGIATVTITKDGSLTIEGLPAGPYTVIETGKPDSQDGSYYCSGTTYQVGNGKKENQPRSATVSAGTETTVTVENTYTKYRTVTITKSVMGPMGDTTEAFDFTTSVTRTVGETDKYSNSINSASASNGSMQLKKGDDSTGSVEIAFAGDTTGTADGPATAALTSDGYTLADEDSITISKLKVGDKLAITEPYAKSKGYSVTWSNNATGGNVTVNDDMTITVTNTREVVTPTGLESNHTKPYALMVGAGALAGLALVGGILARRARRRREW